MPEINFLTHRQLTLNKVDAQDKIYQKYGLIIFIFSLRFFLISLGANFFFTKKLKETQQRQMLLTDQITNNEPVEIKYLIFAHKLGSIKKLYENRSNKQQAIDYFSNLFEGDAFLSGMNYGGEGNSLSLKISSDSIFALEETSSLLDSVEVKQAFSSIKKSGLRRDEEGKYSLDISIELRKEKDKV